MNVARKLPLKIRKEYLYQGGFLLLWLILGTNTPGAWAQTRGAARRVQVHLYGGDMRPGAPLAAWYRSLGITDVWLYPFQGAFPQDQLPEHQCSVEKAAALVAAYRAQGVRCWWMERPVPDVLYQQAKTEGRHLWDSSPQTDQLWAEIVAKIKSLYPRVRAAGFAGVVYDNEAYYSYQGDEAGTQRPWLWGGHNHETGRQGNYYRRGRQIGAALRQAWPDIRVIMVYAFGYPGERFWYQGFHEAGIALYLGVEHTYGAGPPHDLGEAWYQSWWQGRHLGETLEWKRQQFPFVPSRRKFIAGLFPINFGEKKPNYRARYFREQLQQAAQSLPEGPIAVWLWPQGPFTPESWEQVRFAPPDCAQDYIAALRDFSAAFARP